MSSVHWEEVVAAAWPLLIALLLGLAVRQVLMAISRRAGRQAATHTRARVVQVIAVPAALALPLLFLSMAVRTVALEEVWIARIQHALGIGGLACLTWLALRAVAAIERRILREHPIEVADNLAARRIQTQTRVIASVVKGAVMLVGAAVILMTFPAIRQIGATLLASAGLIGLVAGIAARPVFGNLIAGLQIALTQPIRLDDVVIVEGEWGRVETITSAFVVVRVWDERRLIVPLQWFIENPFQNWTHTSAELLGATFLWLDYRTPMDAVRAELKRICESDDRWDGRVCVAQVTETDQTAQQVRLLVSARNSGDLFDLRCAARERMIDFLNARHPQSLPRLRMDLTRSAPDAAPDAQGLASGTAWIGERTSSPGAESVTQADIAARRAQAQASH